MPRNTRIYLSFVLLLTVAYLAAITEPYEAQAQQCSVPAYAAEPLGSMMTWAYQGLEAEPESFKAAAMWLAQSEHSRGAGPYMGAVLLRVIDLANNIDPQEWEAIGVSVGCAEGGIYQGYCE